MSGFICEVYACAEAPDRWRNVLDDLCRRIGVRSAVLQILDRDEGRLRRVWEVRDSYSYAHREMHDLVLNNDDNPRLRAAVPSAPLRGRNVLRDEDVFAPESEELVQLRLRLATIDLGCNAAGFADLAEGRHVALVVHRSAEDLRPMGAEEEGLLSFLMPHVRQSVCLMGRLNAVQQQAELLNTACDALGAGVLICGSDGEICWASEAARLLIRGSPYIRESDGRLRATRASERAVLSELLAQASTGAACGPRFVGLGDGPEMVHVLAASQPGSPAGPVARGRPGVLLFLRQPRKPPKVPPELVSRLFGITAAEARVTAALCEGLSLADYAAGKGISVGTARIQLKRALAKSGAHRQSELVRRVCAALFWIDYEARLEPESPLARPRSRLQ